MNLFFKKIRRKLAYDNRLFKYARYAIGEILLVVVGILIALQVNNWNEQKKLNAKEQKILIQLQSEYQRNLAQLDEKILMRNETIDAALKLLQCIDKRKPLNEEEFYKNLWQLVQDPTFDPIQNDILETENLRLIKNDTLIGMLSNWSTEVFQVQEIELQYQKFRTEVILPRFIELGISRNVQSQIWKDGFTPTFALNKEEQTTIKLDKSKKELDLHTVLNDVELEGIISYVISLHNLANIQSNTLRTRILRMLQIMNQEIKS